MRVAFACITLALLLSTVSVSAMNRCTDANGKVTYSDKPCPSAEQRSRVKIVDSAGFVPERAPRLTSVEPVDSTRRPVPAIDAAQSPARIGRTQAEIRCANAKHDYEFQAGSKHKRLADMRAAKIAAAQACGAEVAATEEHTALELQAQRLAERRAEAQRRRQEALTSMDGAVVHNCDGGGCNTSEGRITGNPRATMAGPNGVTCRFVGDRLHCN
jgi:Domain of unknown function (DUF4124)